MNIKLRVFTIFLCFVGLTSISCESDDDSEIEVIELNVEKKYQKSGFAVKFRSVISDSRCPINLVCVWGGNAEVKFNYNTNVVNSDFILNTHPGFRTDTLINNYRITLIDVFPYPETDKGINPNDYIVKIKINKE